ncbi:phosphoglycolate phosphatase 2-like [Asbolus verrucosus]|uniref:Phosphoglycolate phosphatase 2-like n=1 Tax=Asbolus verrucosus TaxID=1661398 RepID=A0A482WBM8_ASBVE|nr:phosphoglycolate phosphatase 2-like [Asbolus verrucosus]
MKDLNSVSKEEQEDFFNSFDLILCDVDGVLWLFLENLPGIEDGIKSFKKIGKKVVFVSNNCTKSHDFYLKQLKSAGFELEKDDLITPALAMVSYLKKLQFTKEIYLIGMTALRKELERGGFKVAEYGPDRIKETLQDLAANTIVDNENVGAVIADADINLNYVKLQKAATYLKRPEVIFITGATDMKLPVGLNHVLLGPGYFHKILEDMTGRTPHALAKPSPYLNEYVVEKLKIDDRSRVLFIGDS